MRRILIPIAAFVIGSTVIASIYFGILIWAQGVDAVPGIFLPNRWYVIPIWITFGIQVALYSILRFRLFVPISSTKHTGTVMGTSGGTSVTAMVACCIHHVTDVLPVLGLSAAATFLTRYQRPFMLVGLGMNIVGILVMLIVLYREYRKLNPSQNAHPVLETP
jgi:phosphoglycerol transferase MdoB-like AlkP superfamily enzyme